MNIATPKMSQLSYHGLKKYFQRFSPTLSQFWEIFPREEFIPTSETTDLHNGRT